MEHVKEIQSALKFIESNLSNDITLESIASAVGFSKFHFHRKFQKEVGMSIYDYVRKRRLANASALLINTDMPILEIAISFKFESQESFTRAFKSIYQLPPNRYRNALKNLLTGGHNMNENTEIKGWILSGQSPQKYRLYMDEKIFNTATKSACLKSIEEECDLSDFATIMQQFNAKNFLKKRVRLSGFIKAQDVTGWCGLWVRIDDVYNNVLKFDNMQFRPITGTTEWNHYSCVVDTPENSHVISIGMLLSGKGQVWLDNVSFQEVDLNTKTTDQTSDVYYPDYPVNLTFEEGI